MNYAVFFTRCPRWRISQSTYKSTLSLDIKKVQNLTPTSMYKSTLGWDLCLRAAGGDVHTGAWWWQNIPLRAGIATTRPPAMKAGGGWSTGNGGSSQRRRQRALLLANRHWHVRRRLSVICHHRHRLALPAFRDNYQPSTCIGSRILAVNLTNQKILGLPTVFSHS